MCLCQYSLKNSRVLYRPIHLFPFLSFSQCGVLVNVWNDKLFNVQLKKRLCIYVLSAPRLSGQCTFMRATSHSLTFRWTLAKSATSYRLVGHSRSASTATHTITVNSLTAGTYYRFTLWAVGWQQLRSNNITCTGFTGLSEISLGLFFLARSAKFPTGLLFPIS